MKVLIMKKLFTLFIMSMVLLQNSASALHSFNKINLLTEENVAQAKQELSRQIMLKKYFSKTGYVLAPAMIAFAAYHYGLFDFILGRKKTIAPIAPENIAATVALLQNQFQAMQQSLPSKSSYLVEFGKAVGWQGLTTVAGTILVQSPLMAAFTKPDYEWIFKNKTHVLRLADDGLYIANQYARYAVIDPLKAAYYKDELQHIINGLHKDFSYLIAYLEHEVEQIPQEVAHETNMDAMPRFLFNEFNEFLKKCHDAFNTGNALEIVNQVKELRANLVNSYDHCIIFSEQF